MNEKILAKSERYSVKQLVKAMAIITAILVGLTFIATMLIAVVDSNSASSSSYGSYYNSYNSRSGDQVVVEAIVNAILYSLGIAVSMAILGVIIGVILNHYTITISDKRVHLKLLFGLITYSKPLDTITYYGKTRIIRYFYAGAASIAVAIPFVKNVDELNKALSGAIIERVKRDEQNTAALNTLMAVAIAPKAEAETAEAAATE